MAFILKSVCKSFTGAATETLYSATSPASAIINGIRFYNKDTVGSPTMTMEVVPTAGGTVVPITNIGFSVSAQATMSFEDPVTLGPGDSVRLIVGGSPTPSVTCMVNVLERE
jgi:hypothetical protein